MRNLETNAEYLMVCVIFSLCLQSHYYLIQQGLLSRNCGWDVIQVEEDVECGKVSNEVSFTAVSEEEDGVNCLIQVRARTVDSD